MIQYCARYNNTDYKIVGNELPQIKDSSRETKFSSIEILFQNGVDNIIPIQLQEIRIIKKDGASEEVIMTCYVESVEYPEFEFDDQPFILTINVISPYAYSSKRTITYTANTISLATVVQNVLQPLISDGFVIEENELSTTVTISEIFKVETIEKIMNYMANKYKFVWYIDKEKKIYVKYIDSLTVQEPVISITDENRCYLKKIKPNINLVDYANKLTIKNAYLLTSDYSYFFTEDYILLKGKEYIFEHPFSMSENTSFRKLSSLYNSLILFSINLNTGTNNFNASIKANFNNKTITKTSNLSIDFENENTDIIMISDSNDHTKIIGFKWNREDFILSYGPDDFVEFISENVLKPTSATFVDANEISKVKDKMNTSGIIERIIDANGKYFIFNELEDYTTNLFSQNNIVTNDIECSFKGRLNDSEFINILNLLKITKVFSVNLPKFNINGNFIITSTSYRSNTQTAELKLEARNYNMNENYLDIYRVDFKQETDEQVTDKLMVFYNKDNSVISNKEVYVNGVLVNENL